jgi:hypothetical protein
MQKTSDRSFALTIEDRFDPNEDYVVEVTDMDTFSGVSKIDGKAFTSLIWIYRIFDQDGVVFTDAVSGAPWEGRVFSSMALGGQAKGRLWASGFLGHELSDAECDAIADNFDGAIVGKHARVSFKVVAKKNADGTPLGSNLEWALVRPMPKAAPRAATPPTARAVAPTPIANGAAPKAAKPQAEVLRGVVPETPAQKRARLVAELEAMENSDEVSEDGADGHDLPF